MAYVRLTKQVKDRIIDSSYSLFHNAIQKAKEALPEDFWQQCFDDFYDNEIEPYIKQGLPSTWLVEVKRVNLTFYISDKTHQRREYFKPLTQPRKMPRIIDLVSANDATIPDDYSFPEDLKNVYIEYTKRVDLPEQEYAKFKTELTSYLDKCNTLKQFLTGWPNGEELIPYDILQAYQFEKTTTRKKREPVTPSIDLNAGLLRSKIMKNI
jgi:hypothetical protein